MSGKNSSANHLLELEAQTTNHEPAATGDEQGEAERDKTQRDATQKYLGSKFRSVYPWDSSESEASVSNEVESVSESQRHADESAVTQLCVGISFDVAGSINGLST